MKSSRFLSGVDLDSLSVDQLPDPPSPTSLQVRRSTRIQKLKYKPNGAKIGNNNISATTSTVSKERDWKDAYELSDRCRNDKRSKSHIARRRSSPNLTPPSFTYLDDEKVQPSPLQDMTNKNKELRSLKSLKNKLNSRRSSISVSKRSKNRRNSLSLLPSQPNQSHNYFTNSPMQDLPASDNQSHDKWITAKSFLENNQKKRRQSILLPSDKANDGDIIDDDSETLELAQYMDFSNKTSILSKVDDNRKNIDNQPKKKRNLLPPTYNNLKSSRTSNDTMITSDKTNEKKSKYSEQLAARKINHLNKFTLNTNQSAMIQSKTLQKNQLEEKRQKSTARSSTIVKEKISNVKELKHDSNKEYDHNQNLLQNIRKYCSLKVSERERYPCVSANFIEQFTKYKLPPRIKYEEQPNKRRTQNDKQKENKNFKGTNDHSFLNNLDKKRELLLKMGPVVEQLEEQRKQQSIDLENATQCKVISKRGRYEYIHKQTGKRVTPDAYKKIYLSQIEKNCLKLKPKENIVHQPHNIQKNVPVKNTIDGQNSTLFNCNESNEIAKTIQSIFHDSPSSVLNDEEQSTPFKRKSTSRRSLAPILGSSLNQAKLHEIETNNDMSISMDIDSDDDSGTNHNAKILDKSNLPHLKQIEANSFRQNLDSKLNSGSSTTSQSTNCDKDWVYSCYLQTSNVVSQYLPNDKSTGNYSLMLKAKEKLLSNIKEALVSYSTEVMEIKRKSTR